MNIKLTSGDILKSNCDAITIPVNCVGVMGKGLAKTFALQNLGAEQFYKKLCHDKILKIGYPVIIENSLNKKQYFIFFPTKQHWKNNSQISWILSGLTNLLDQIKNNKNIKSLAIPKLGCGLGQIDWNVLRPQIINIFNSYEIELNVEIYI